MHEYSIVQALVAKVTVEAQLRGGTTVHSLSVKLGELSGVEPELLRTAFETFREGTICSRAELTVGTVPAAWGCPRCERPMTPGRCGSCDVPARLLQGDEILLERIELEVA